jgi:glycosyltransferase involved in cell wall biosynthesis
MLDIDPTRIKNISSAADPIFSPLAMSLKDAKSVTQRLGIVRKYLMHSSVFEARKNFQGLIRAYAALPKAIRVDHQLVLVCKLDVVGREELTGLARKLGLAADTLVLPGFVTDTDLIALYRACHLFVFPSFYEGFGLPALEAMCCGTPTIGSNATSIPDVIGRKDALFDPASIQEMTALMLKALTNVDFYQSLKNHAKVQAARFSWDETARHAIVGLGDLVTQRGPPVRGIESPAARRRRMLDAVAEVARHMPPSDFEILKLARSIEDNHNAVSRLKASASFLPF